jgi:hypothetical protein
MTWRAGWAVSAVVLWVAALACDVVSTPGGTGSPSPTIAGATATPKPDFDPGVILEEFPPGGPRNEVRLENTEDGRFKARASIKLHRITNDDIDPVNIAFAQGRCTDCQTIAVAVQVVLYQRGARSVQPQNIALAANVGCTRCVTVARAIQYVIPVDDPKEVSAEVSGLIKDIDKELRFLASIKTWDQITSEEAMGRLESVLTKYASLHQYLWDLMQKQTAPDAAPSSASPTPTASPSGEPQSPTPSPSATPTATP